MADDKFSNRDLIARIIAPSSFANPGSTTWKEREAGRRGALEKADAILAALRTKALGAVHTLTEGN